MNLDVNAAKTEVQEKDEHQIESETALKWAARSIACFQLYDETDELKWLFRAEDMRHEAIEHASLADEETLDFVRKELDEAKAKLTPEAE